MNTDKWDNVLQPQTVDDADLREEVLVAPALEFPRQLLDGHLHGLPRPSFIVSSKLLVAFLMSAKSMCIGTPGRLCMSKPIGLLI